MIMPVEGKEEGALVPSRRVLTLFLAVEAVLYAAFLTWDLTIGGRGSNPIKFAGILLCLGYSLYLARRGGSRLVPAALTLTSLADVFLLLLDTHYALGVILFCLVQGLYLVRIYRCNGGRSLWGLRVALFLLALLVLKGLGLLIPLNILALFYFTNFLCNALASLCCSGRSMKLFSVGLWLFLCCDLCVGLFQSPELISPAVGEFVRIGMWLFYLPAQVLIALSGANHSLGGTPYETK